MEKQLLKYYESFWLKSWKKQKRFSKIFSLILIFFVNLNDLNFWQNSRKFLRHHLLFSISIFFQLKCSASQQIGCRLNLQLGIKFNQVSINAKCKRSISVCFQSITFMTRLWTLFCIFLTSSSTAVHLKFIIRRSKALPSQAHKTIFKLAPQPT